MDEGKVNPNDDVRSEAAEDEETQATADAPTEQSVSDMDEQRGQLAEAAAEDAPEADRMADDAPSGVEAAGGNVPPETEVGTEDRQDAPSADSEEPEAEQAQDDETEDTEGGSEATPEEAEGAAEGPPDEQSEDEPAAPEADDAESGMSEMERLLEEGDYLPEKIDRGDLVEGTVVRRDEEQLILDIGAKQQGVVPHGDILRLPRGYLDDVSVGDTINVVVLRPDWREGEVLVSVYQAQTMEDWVRARENLDSGDIEELEVVGYNKGGVLVQFGHLQGFVPRSHLAGLGAPGEGDASGGGPLEQLVGSEIPVKVIEVSRRRRRLIMSHRQALHQWRSERKMALIDELQEGEIRKGRVSSIADFGAFVDLGGADGLVHVSELTYERGKHPRDVVSVGQEVEVYVLSVDLDRRRIGLSMKRLQSDPWATVEQDHYVGELVEATISNLTKFGAFARLEDGLEGLIHISELSDSHVEHPREVIKPGQRVTVEVISIDSARQRIGLSIRRVPEHLRAPVEEPPEPEPEPEPEAEAAAEEPAAEAEAEPEAEAAAEEPAAEAEAEPEPEEEGEPEAEEESEGEPEPEAEAAAEEPAAEAEAEPEPEEEGEPEPEAEAAVEEPAAEAEAEPEADDDAESVTEEVDSESDAEPEPDTETDEEQ